ncbi:MAG: rhodanese-like domain-containing protein [Chitinophagales bacterium]|nr:rhodanese-like domain-containing protein [Chitinophagales bacterium]
MKKVLLVSFALLLCAILCRAQVQSGAYRVMLRKLLSHSVPEIQVEDLMRDSSAAAGILFLDAREPKEFQVSHLNGALPVGYDHFKLSNLPDTLAKDQRIVVYCSVGYRSEKVAEKLIAAGFTNVQNLYGGIFEWVNRGNTVYDAQGATPRVHAFDRTWGVWLRKGKKIY